GRRTDAPRASKTDQPGGGPRPSSARPDTKLRGRPPYHYWIPYWIGRRDEKQKPRRRRQGRQPLPEALLDAPGQRRAVGQAEPAREVGKRPATGQLQQRQRVAARLGADPTTAPLVERASDPGGTQPPSIRLIHPRDDELRQPSEMPFAARLAHGEDQSDCLRTETTRDECKRLCRGRVEPLSVVHDA